MSAKTITKRMLKEARLTKSLADKAQAGTLTVTEAMVLASLQPKPQPEAEPQAQPA